MINVRGIAHETKRRAIFDFHRANSDILILLESHSDADSENIWQNEWGGKGIFSHGTKQARGVTVLMDKHMYDKVSKVYTQPNGEGRIVIFDITEGEETSTLMALYAPNHDQPEFFKQVAELLRDRKEHKIILGDFNLTMNVELDRLNTFCNNTKSRDKVENLMDEFFIKDIWSDRNESKKEYSWFKRNGQTERKASRIDFALVSGGLDQKVKEIMYISSIKTDHRAIYMVIDMIGNERGSGYWKLNTSLLRDLDYVNMINQELDYTVSASRHESSKEKWEYIKTRVKKRSIEFSRNKSSQEKLIISELSEKVNEYEANLPLVKDIDDLYEKKKSDLEEKVMERIEGVMFRSRARWYELGEKSNKYFFSLEKARYNAKTCFKLLKESGEEIIGDYNILKAQRQFYQELYAKDEDVEFTLTNGTTTKVPPEIKVQQDQLITIEELQLAMKAMRNSKTPGSDGLPVGFYKIFWSKLKTSFFEMVNQSFEEQLLHDTAREGILNLIPKSNKDSRFIKNLRPINPFEH